MPYLLRWVLGEVGTRHGAAMGAQPHALARPFFPPPSPQVPSAQRCSLPTPPVAARKTPTPRWSCFPLLAARCRAPSAGSASLQQRWRGTAAPVGSEGPPPFLPLSNDLQRETQPHRAMGQGPGILQSVVLIPSAPRGLSPPQAQERTEGRSHVAAGPVCTTEQSELDQ